MIRDVHHLIWDDAAKVRRFLQQTAVRDPRRLPEHMAGDEHHADWCGDSGLRGLHGGVGLYPGRFVQRLRRILQRSLAKSSFSLENSQSVRVQGLR